MLPAWKHDPPMPRAEQPKDDKPALGPEVVEVSELARAAGKKTNG